MPAGQPVDGHLAARQTFIPTSFFQRANGEDLHPQIAIADATIVAKTNSSFRMSCSSGITTPHVQDCRACVGIARKYIVCRAQGKQIAGGKPT